jgi:hypothetical protein
LTVALGNANHILGITPDAQNREETRDKTKRETQEL